VAEIDLDKREDEKRGGAHRVKFGGEWWQLRGSIPGRLVKRAKNVLQIRNKLETASKGNGDGPDESAMMDGLDEAEVALLDFLKPFFRDNAEYERFVATEPGIYELMKFTDGILPLYDLEGGLGESQASARS
jgi:hypothetical protein